MSISGLNDQYRQDLLDVLDSIRSYSKHLVLDSELYRLFSFLLPYDSEELKSRAVVGVYEMIEGSAGNDEYNRFDPSGQYPEDVIFMCHPRTALMKTIATEIDRYEQAAITNTSYNTNFHVFFVPNRTKVCEQVLEDLNVLDKVIVGEMVIGFVSIDEDLLTLEWPHLFRDVYIEDDVSSLRSVALALASLQQVVGTIPNVRAKGGSCEAVLRQMMNIRQSGALERAAGVGILDLEPPDGLSPTGQGTGSLPTLDTLLMIDRDVDLVTPLVTPLTYEGLLDEVIGIEGGHSELPESVLVDEFATKMGIDALGETRNSLSAEEKRQVAQAGNDIKHLKRRGTNVLLPLNSKVDPTFGEIRNLSIEGLARILQTGVVRIQGAYSNFRDRPDAPIAEIHEFVKQIPILQGELRLLNQHINISELLRRTTDSWVFREHWQLERGALEGDNILDILENEIMSDVYLSWKDLGEDPPGEIRIAQEPHRFLGRLVSADGTRLSQQDSPERGMWVNLRLLCIQSLAMGGIRASRYDSIRRLLVQTYGLKAHLTMLNLEKCGMLFRKEVLLIDTSTSVFTTLRQKLRLIADQEVDIANPKDLGYVTAGYAAMSCRLVQFLGNHSTVSAAGLADILKLLPGPTLEFRQKQTSHQAQTLESALEEFAALPTAHQAPRHVPTNANALAHGEEEAKPIMLVMFTGGVSWTEVASLRFLSNDRAFPFRIIIASTCFMSANKFVASIAQDAI